MAMEYMHLGIPITNKKPNMTYNEDMKLWMSNPDDYDEKIEYLKFEEGTFFPEIMHRQCHVAYKVDDMTKYLKEADSVLVEPITLSDTTRIAFIIKDNAIMELYEDKTWVV